VQYNYGSKADEIDPFFREKRSWSKVKDKIVGDYIDCYLRTVHNLHRPVLIVDGFSGPGIFGDNTLGSPLITCKAVAANRRGVGIRCLFADVRPGHRAALERALAEHIASGVAQAPLPDCAAALTRALEQHANSTIFFYLDPYGIKDLEFDMVRQIYERAQRRSTEVLINFNFRAFMRMSGNWKYTDSADEIARRVKEEKVETVNRVMGGEYWKDIILDPALTKIDREDAVIGAYLLRVREFFPFAYAIPVKERDGDQQNIPVDELAHYHLIFATRSPRAVVYMNDVGLNALEPYLNQFKDGLLFDFTPERYQRISDEDAKNAIVEAATEKPLTRPEIYEVVFPRFFMHHKKLAYRAWIDDLVFKEGRLHPKRDEMKSKTQLNDNVRLWAKPWDLL